MTCLSTRFESLGGRDVIFGYGVQTKRRLTLRRGGGMSLPQSQNLEQKRRVQGATLLYHRHTSASRSGEALVDLPSGPAITFQRAVQT